MDRSNGGARIASAATLGLVVACHGGSGPTRSSVPSAEAQPRAPSAPITAASRPLAPPALPAPAEPEWPPAPPQGVSSDFCIDIVDVLDESSCYVLPDARTDELLLYLHGIVPPAKTSVQKTNFETVVANASRRAGVAALIPRGRKGLAPKRHEDWWGWPTSGESYQRHTPEILRELAEKRQKLEALVGRPFTRLYVAGSSSGAYFAAALALRGDLDADAFGAFSGGAATARARPESLSPKPFYVGYGSYDTVGSGAEALAQRLRTAGWPVSVGKHPTGHGAREVYLDEAFVFWRAHVIQRSERLGETLE